MKSSLKMPKISISGVALLVSAWIEIRLDDIDQRGPDVALLVSAWIEIRKGRVIPTSPSVALLVSAWIEIHYQRVSARCKKSHSS